MYNQISNESQFSSRVSLDTAHSQEEGVFFPRLN